MWFLVKWNPVIHLLVLVVRKRILEFIRDVCLLAHTQTFLGVKSNILSNSSLTCPRWEHTGWEQWCPRRLSAGRAPVYTDPGQKHCCQKASVTPGADGKKERKRKNKIWVWWNRFDDHSTLIRLEMTISLHVEDVSLHITPWHHRNIMESLVSHWPCGLHQLINRRLNLSCKLLTQKL